MRVGTAVGVNVIVGVMVKDGEKVKVGVRIIVGVSVMIRVSKAEGVFSIVGDIYCVEKAEGSSGMFAIVGNLSILGDEKISVIPTMQHAPSRAIDKKPRQR